MGEMYSYYSLANIALMGGTILPYGGQNLIESMAMKVPVILGPHTYNFHDVSNEAIRLGAGIRIQTLDQLEKVLPQMLKSSSQLKMKKACGEMIHAHQGATLKILNKVNCSELDTILYDIFCKRLLKLRLFVNQEVS